MSAYISEIDTRGGPGNEFVEVAAPAGTDLSGYSLYIYDTNGTVLAGPFTFGPADGTIAGRDVYVLDNTDGLPGIQQHHGVALVDDQGNTLQFVSFGGINITAQDGPAAGQSSTDIGSQSETGSLQSDDGGQTYYAQSSPNAGTVPCFAIGTLIDTPRGPCPVEDLRVGAEVSTVDGSTARILWMRWTTLELRDVAQAKKPVRIAADALGPGRPATPLVVSPQHRILVGGHGQLDGFANPAVFVPAKALTALPGVRHMYGCREITWVHFACAGHEIVTAQGCVTESLLLGPMILTG